MHYPIICEGIFSRDRTRPSFTNDKGRSIGLAQLVNIAPEAQPDPVAQQTPRHCRKRNLQKPTINDIKTGAQFRVCPRLPEPYLELELLTFPSGHSWQGNRTPQKPISQLGENGALSDQPDAQWQDRTWIEPDDRHTVRDRGRDRQTNEAAVTETKLDTDIPNSRDAGSQIKRQMKKIGVMTQTRIRLLGHLGCFTGSRS